MAEDSGCVTLIFYKVGDKWWREPMLNIIAAVAQMSSFTHVELAIGEEHSTDGAMRNVCRVFNDAVGCELTGRTGRNPQYTYLQLGCSKAQEIAMLKFARSCVGRPFSTSGMARSVVWPRQTDRNSYFCAELVADILRHGGLLDKQSNPGAATPEGLHNLYKSRAATTANPYLLRQANLQQNLSIDSVVTNRVYTPPQLKQNQERHGQGTPAAATAGAMASAFQVHSLFPFRQNEALPSSHVDRGGGTNGLARGALTSYEAHKTFRAATKLRDASLCGGSVRSNSALRVLNAGDKTMHPNRPPLGLTFNSLDFRKL